MAGHATAEGFLCTDQYQLTMAQLYHRLGLAERCVRFEHFFRNYPDYGAHRAGYCIHAGMQWLVEWMGRSAVRTEDLRVLAAQRDSGGHPMFDAAFLEWLGGASGFPGLRIQSIPEGRVVHPLEPLTVVEGPLALAQLLETALLNQVNYQTLVATKASRVREAGQGQPLVDFGLRRGQERGALAGSRAALIGGADFSSSVGISHELGLAPKGTHAHSMVQLFIALGLGERGAFEAYADLYPDDCLLLVDTIDTLGSGIPNAIAVFERLRRQGHRPAGVRLDSGDLAYLAIQTALQLDRAGFAECRIVLSNQLDELVILQILRQIQDEAGRYGVDADHLVRRLVFGVGTRLVTSEGCAALDGVYKLVAVTGRDGRWQPVLKRSETPSKTLIPGRKRVWRLYDGRRLATADLIGLEEEDPATGAEIVLHHPLDEGRRRVLRREEVTAVEEVLRDVAVTDRQTWPSVGELRLRRDRDLAALDPGVRRILNPHVYHVSVTERLWTLRKQLAEQLLHGSGSPPVV